MAYETRGDGRVQPESHSFKQALMIYQCPGSELVGNPPIACSTRVVDAGDKPKAFVLPDGWYEAIEEADAAYKAGREAATADARVANKLAEAEAARLASINAVEGMNDKEIGDYAAALGLQSVKDEKTAELKKRVIAVLTPKK